MCNGKPGGRVRSLGDGTWRNICNIRRERERSFAFYGFKDRICKRNVRND